MCVEEENVLFPCFGVWVHGSFTACRFTYVAALSGVMSLDDVWLFNFALADN